MDIKKNEQYYKYLYRLQRSGETNMYGAAPYLQQMFGLSKSEARDILMDWMDRYDEIATELGVEV